MEKAQPGKEEAKQKLDGGSRFLSIAQPWAVGLAGAGFLLLGLGASTLQPSHGGRSLHPFSSNWQRGGGHKVHLPKKPSRVSDLDEAPADSLEDVLDKLDGESTSPRKKAPSSKGDKSRTASKTKKLAKDEPSDELAEDEREEAKDLVRESIKKLEAEQRKKPSAKTRKTLAKLRALLGEEEEPEKEPDEDEAHQMDFVKALKAEQERKAHVDLKTVKDEFKKDFGTDARSLLCSGCRLVASRLTSELEDHDVHGQERPAQLIAAKRKAIDSTCSHLQHFQAVVSEGGPVAEMCLYGSLHYPGSPFSGVLMSSHCCKRKAAANPSVPLLRLGQHLRRAGVPPP
eukprot:TRINITY_DN3626_c0_g2_i2.p1 TRINITY_DN3626_c0_g2~~TRINITY_DN3626_c0_g2_i2.p1  ORF type:complete len:351 (-),score=83.84 TRINITY_DN3626_c0_g2_i2:234-1262(-)